MDPNLASNSSDEASYCSMFEDDCDHEMNKWFELFFFNVDQAVFYDKKLSEKYEKIDKECKIWNNLFKLKKVDLTDPELKRTIFTSEKLGKKLQLIEETCSDTGQHLMLRREKSFPQESEPRPGKASSKSAIKQNKAMNRYFELNDQFDKITLMNQIKQDYIRKHVLNSSPKSDGNSSPHHSLSVYSPSVLFPVTTNSNLGRRKQMMLEQSKLNDEAASSCLYFFPSRKKEQAKLKKQASQQKEDKGKVRTLKSIMKIDQGNTSNMILNSEQIIQPPRLKTPIVLPPLHKSDLPQRFDKITLHDQNQAIVACDKSSKQCSLNLRKGQELRLSAFKRPMMLSIKNEFFK